MVTFMLRGRGSPLHVKGRGSHLLLRGRRVVTFILRGRGGGHIHVKGEGRWSPSC